MQKETKGTWTTWDCTDKNCYFAMMKGMLRNSESAGSDKVVAWNDTGSGNSSVAAATREYPGEVVEASTDTLREH